MVQAESNKKAKKLGTSLAFLALVVAAVTTVLWSRRVDAVSIPENRSVFVFFFLVAAVLGISAFVARTRWFGGIAAALAIVIGGFFPFTVAISRQEVAPDSIEVGDTIPHFTALDDQGQLFDSKTLDGKLVLMKFFRGHW